MDSIAALTAAIEDPLQPVRLGALHAAPSLAGDDHRSPSYPLADHAWHLMRNWGPDRALEAAVLAGAMPQVGLDPWPILGRLLGESDQALDSVLLAGSQASWGEMLLRKSASGLLAPAAARLLTPLWNRVNATQLASVDPPAPAALTSARAQAALSELQFAQGQYTPFDASGEIQDAFAPAAEALGQKNLAKAIACLIPLAVASPHPVLRDIARQALAPLGAPAGRELLRVLSGETLEKLTETLARAGPAGDLASGELAGLARDQLVAFFATEALQGFHDRTTADAAVNGALLRLEHGDAKAAAPYAQILAGMTADLALPGLAVAAAGNDQLAGRLLKGLTTGRGAMGLPEPQVGASPIAIDTLSWIPGLAENPSRHSWLQQADVARAVVGAGLRVLRDVEGFDGQLFQIGPAEERFAAFQAANSALASGLAGSTAVAVGASSSDAEGPLSISPLPDSPAPPPPDDPGGPPRTEFLRHPEVRFPAQCALGVPVALTVRLLEQRTDVTAPPFAVPIPAGAAEARLLVTARSRGFDCVPEFRPLVVPRVGASEWVEFQLTAHQPGRHAIDIKFFADGTMIGHCAIVSEVLEAPGEGLAPTLILDPVRSAAAAGAAGAHASLLVREINQRLAWWLIGSDGKCRELGISTKPVSASAIQNWSVTNAELIKGLLTYNLPEGDRLGAMSQLQAQGRALLAQIAPPAAATAVTGLAQGTVLAVESDTDWVPWELLADAPGTPLWGERFVIVRLPTLHDADNPPITAPAAPARASQTATVVIGDAIANPKSMPNRLFDGRLRKVVPLENPDWQSLKASASSADLLHFACHGRTEPKPYHLSYGAPVTRRLYPEQARDLGLRHGTVVFANACGSAAPQMLLLDFQSFGQQFHLAGARPFIGTLGPVPEAQALDFAAWFYEAFCVERLPAGAAMSAARAKSAATHKIPIHLFYALYGSALVTWPPS